MSAAEDPLEVAEGRAAEERALAVLMGTHGRLGAATGLRWLGDDELRLIARHAATWTVAGAFFELHRMLAARPGLVLTPMMRQAWHVHLVVSPVRREERTRSFRVSRGGHDVWVYLGRDLEGECMLVEVGMQHDLRLHGQVSLDELQRAYALVVDFVVRPIRPPALYEALRAFLLGLVAGAPHWTAVHDVRPPATEPDFALAYDDGRRARTRVRIEYSAQEHGWYLTVREWGGERQTARLDAMSRAGLDELKARLEALVLAPRTSTASTSTSQDEYTQDEYTQDEHLG